MTSTASRRRISGRGTLALAALVAVAVPVADVTADAVADARSATPHAESALLALAGSGALVVLALLAALLVTVAVELLGSPGTGPGDATGSLVPPMLRGAAVGVLVGAAALSPQLASAAPARGVAVTTTPAPVDPGYLPTQAPTGTAPTTPAGSPASAATPSPAPGAAPVSAPATPRTHRVGPGDTLWEVAVQVLAETHPHPDDARVARAVHLLYAANAAAIGDDPDLIHPGTTLVVPEDLAARSARPTPRSTP